MSDAVERRLLDLLDHPTESPFGNPIPGLRELDPAAVDEPVRRAVPVAAVAGEQPGSHTVARIAERLQEHSAVLVGLREAGVVPGAQVTVSRAADGSVHLRTAQGQTVLPSDLADFLAVLARPADAPQPAGP